MTSAINVAKMLPTDLFERAPNGDKRPILAIKWHHGEMAERTKAPVSKTGIRATVSWVRIPLSPPGLASKNATNLGFIDPWG